MNKLKRFNFCKENIVEWQDMFYKFLDGTYTLLDLEKNIFTYKELEEILGSNVYLELISFNFLDKTSNYEIKEFIENHIIEDVDIHKWKVCSMINDALGNIQERESIQYSEDIRLPELFLKEFGGLKVGEIGAGIDIGKSNVEFFLKPYKSDLEKHWEDLLGKLSLIGKAHHDNIYIFMNEQGIMYIYMDMVDIMYFGGDFEETMTKLLLGIDFGIRIK